MYWIMTFLQEVKTELLKIEWPTWEEFVGSTVITLLLVLLFTLFIFGVDRSISYVITHYIFTYGV